MISVFIINMILSIIIFNMIIVFIISMILTIKDTVLCIIIPFTCYHISVMFRNFIKFHRSILYHKPNCYHIYKVFRKSNSIHKHATIQILHRCVMPICYCLFYCRSSSIYDHICIFDRSSALTVTMNAYCRQCSIGRGETQS